jgi:hypothetical protein
MRHCERKALRQSCFQWSQYAVLVSALGHIGRLEEEEREDTLVIKVEDILVDDYSWTAIVPGRGPPGEWTRWSELSSDYTTMIFKHTRGQSGTLRDGILHFNEHISWPDFIPNGRPHSDLPEFV